jgi:hypothetical protein
VNFLKVILVTVVIFGAGVFTGGLLVNDIDRSQRSAASTPISPPENSEQQPQQHLPEPPLAERLNKQFVRQLDEKLQLTANQREKIAQIVADGQEQNHELWTNVAPKMRTVMSDVNRQIHAELTPKQQRKFEELMKQFAPRRLQNPTNNIFSTNAAATSDFPVALSSAAPSAGKF